MGRLKAIRHRLNGIEKERECVGTLRGQKTKIMDWTESRLLSSTLLSDQKSITRDTIKWEADKLIVNREQVGRVSSWPMTRWCRRNDTLNLLNLQTAPNFQRNREYICASNIDIPFSFIMDIISQYSGETAMADTVNRPWTTFSNFAGLRVTFTVFSTPYPIFPKYRDTCRR